MYKLPKISYTLVLGLLVWTTAAVQAQTANLPPWMQKRTGTPAPQPTSTPAPAPGEVFPEIFGRTPTNNDNDRRDTRYRKGHPHGMPPGQAKKRGYRANPSNGGLPPGQVRPVDNRRYDDHDRDYRRYDDRDRNYRRDDEDRYKNDRRDDDDRRKGGKGKGKGKGRD
ncbi:hypothetical protein [Hymenobacter sp. B1770]|uniref:hypothetical protein n=1 Tax=Hymenobacter sp. B1770 TaxID=1718788 RepID=UPI003CF35D49